VPLQPGGENTADLVLLGVGHQLFFKLGDLLQLLPVYQLGDWETRLLHGQPHHWNHVGNNQNDVLRNLRPGNRLHATQERADQNASEAQENTDFKLHTGQTGGDQTHTINLRDHIRERTDNGNHDADESGHVAAKAGAQKIRDGELAKLAQVGRQKQRNQHVATRPAHNEGQTTVTREVKRTRHADE